MDVLLDIFTQVHYCTIKLYKLLNMWGPTWPPFLGSVTALHFPLVHKHLDPPMKCVKVVPIKV